MNSHKKYNIIRGYSILNVNKKINNRKFILDFIRKLNKDKKKINYL